MFNIGEFEYKLGIIYFLILFFILIICKNLTDTSVEGFTAGDITSIAGKVNDIAAKAGEIPGKITDIGSKITDATSGITGAIDNKITGVLNTVVTPISNTVDQVKTDIRDAKTSITNFPSTVQTTVDRMEDKIMGKVEEKLEAAKTAVKDGIKTELIDPVKETVREANTKITGILGDIVTIFGKIEDLPRIINDFITIAVDKFEIKVIDPIRETIREAKEQIKNIILEIKGLPQVIQGFITEAIDKFENKVIDPIRESIRDAAEKIRDILRKITDIFTKLRGIPGLIRKKIQKKVTWLIRKITNMGKNIGIIIKKGLVKPFITLFEAIVNVPIQTFNILKDIIAKIKILPKCSIVYIMKSIYDAISAVFGWLIPEFILNFFSTIYKYTLKIPVDFIMVWTGFDKWWDKCLDFDVGGEIDSITGGFNDAAKEFKQSFGKMDFGDIFNSNLYLEEGGEEVKEDEEKEQEEIDLESGY
jgi:hypothetical protein